VLGELREALSPKAHVRVAGEIDKDLTRHRVPDIEKALKRQYGKVD